MCLHIFAKTGDCRPKIHVIETIYSQSGYCLETIPCLSLFPPFLLSALNGLNLKNVCVLKSWVRTLAEPLLPSHSSTSHSPTLINKDAF